MNEIVQVKFLEVQQSNTYINLIKQVLQKCFEEENILDKNLYISITLTDEHNIQKINENYRGINAPTDVLSFPMFDKEELQDLINRKEHVVEDILGDIIICIKRVKEQAVEYGHSFERELSYMVVHGFYHLMGYDHIKETDKIKMRPKEEKILAHLQINRK